MYKIVVLGGVAAGMSAASKAKRTNRENQVVVYTDEVFVSYSGCCLPYFVKGIYKRPSSIIVRTPEEFARQGIDLRMECRATAIDTAAKTVTVRTADGSEVTDSYDRLVIATGARPILPDIPGLDLAQVCQVKQIPDVQYIREALRDQQVKKAVVIGGGFIGMEMTEALHSYGVSVTIIERAPQILTLMDPDMAGMIEEELTSKGVQVRKAEEVTALEGDARGVRRVVTDRGSYEADMVIVAIGVTPNSEIAARAGIRTGAKNAILVNEYMETSAPDVYAAGDCATVYHAVSGEDTYVPLGTTANKQGKVAGGNAAGGRLKFPGIAGTTIFKVLDLEGSRTGLSAREAARLGRKVKEIKAASETKATGYPGYSAYTLKLFVEVGTGIIVGAQIVGGEGAGKRIDLLVACVQLGLTAEQLATLDLSYAPPMAPVTEAALLAANLALAQAEEED